MAAGNAEGDFKKLEEGHKQGRVERRGSSLLALVKSQFFKTHSVEAAEHKFRSGL
jgi:hypothetical protein